MTYIHGVLLIFNIGDQGHVVSGTIKAKLSSQLASSLSLTNTVEEAIRHAFSAIDSHICSQNSSDSSGMWLSNSVYSSRTV